MIGTKPPWGRRVKKCPPPLARHVPRSGSPLKPACRGLLLTSHHFSDIFLGGPNPQKQQKRPQKGAKRIETGSRSSSHVHHQLTTSHRQLRNPAFGRVPKLTVRACGAGGVRSTRIVVAPLFPKPRLRRGLGKSGAPPLRVSLPPPAQELTVQAARALT